MPSWLHKRCRVLSWLHKRCDPVAAQVAWKPNTTGMDWSLAQIIALNQMLLDKAGFTEARLNLQVRWACLTGACIGRSLTRGCAGPRQHHQLDASVLADEHLRLGVRGDRGQPARPPDEPPGSHGHRGQLVLAWLPGL